MTRSFIIEPVNLDVGQAAKYGEIVYIFNKNDVRSSIWSKEFRKEVVVRLKRFGYKPRSDFVVVVGHMIPIVIVISELIALYGEIKVLFYSATERDYVTQTIGEKNGRCSCSGLQTSKGPS